MNLLQNLAELAVVLFLHAFFSTGVLETSSQFYLSPPCSCSSVRHVSFIIFHQAGSCCLSDTGHVGASSPHRHLTNLHGCLTVLARRHYLGMGTGEQTIRAHEGTERELPKLLFSASSWIHMVKWVWMQHQLWQTRGTTCTAPSVPLSVSVAFLKGTAQETVVQSSQGSHMEGLGEMGRSLLVPW